MFGLSIVVQLHRLILSTRYLKLNSPIGYVKTDNLPIVLLLADNPQNDRITINCHILPSISELVVQTGLQGEMLLSLAAGSSNRNTRSMLWLLAISPRGMLNTQSRIEYSHSLKMEALTSALASARTPKPHRELCEWLL